MEIKVTYSDYETEIRKARIDFGEEQYIDLSFVEKDKEEEKPPVCPPIEPEEGEEGEEGAKSKKVKIDTVCPIPEKEKKLLIECKDDTISLGIENEVDYREVSKIIAILQRMAKQI